ncbi:MAG: CD1871A family CXXC motif-containing protein [Lachnospiraceae bacterium]|nr:CD1871A family CXXC motif-containing protein [Lachnospiraceae bacterium]
MMGVLVLALGIGLMIMGIRNGEVQVVLEKAIKICMECIGIG